MTSGREKGVATGPCSSCGQELPLVKQPDGSDTTAPCPKCNPDAAPEKASMAPTPPPARQLGTPPASTSSTISPAQNPEGDQS